MSDEAAQKKSVLRRTILAIFALLLIAVVVEVAIVLAQYKSARQSKLITLPDGSTLEFLVCMEGGKQFNTDKPWYSTLRRLLPSTLQRRWIPMRITGSCGDTNDIVAYFRLTTSPFVGARPSWDGYYSEDASGFCYPQGGGYCSFNSSSAEVVYGLTLAAYPRRQKDFVLHFSKNGSDIATVRVPNPLTGPFPKWQAAPMPQTQSNGPVNLTLKSITQRGTKLNPVGSPQWKIESADPAWTNSRVRYFEYHDATGNKGGLLSRQEPAWKLVATVFRDSRQEFAASEQMVLTNLPVPATNAFTSIDQTNTCAGVTVNVQVLSGPGSLAISNGVSRSIVASGSNSGSGRSSTSGSSGTVDTWYSPNHFVLVEVKNAQPNDEIIFRARDDQGREVKIPIGNVSYYRANAGGRIYQTALAPASDAKFLNLTVIVNHPLPFEFLVNPADIQQSAR